MPPEKSSGDEVSAELSNMHIFETGMNSRISMQEFANMHSALATFMCVWAAKFNWGKSGKGEIIS